MITEGVLFPSAEYEYFCYVGNIVESSLSLHKFYGDRGSRVNSIEAGKNQMFACSHLTNCFWAIEALRLLCVIPYDISLWMRRLTRLKLLARRALHIQNVVCSIIRKNGLQWHKS